MTSSMCRAGRRRWFSPRDVVYFFLVNQLPIALDKSLRKRAGRWRREAHRLLLEGDVPVVLPMDDVVKRVEERIETFLRGRTRVVSRPEILGGEPVFEGTRISVRFVGERGRASPSPCCSTTTQHSAPRTSSSPGCSWRSAARPAASGRSSSSFVVTGEPAHRREPLAEAGAVPRAGERGRRPVVTLGALDDEHFGKRDSWTAAAARLGGAPFSLPPGAATRLRWLDAFGQLIGNTDRHFENVVFFVGAEGALRLAPAYDMLPMILAPAAEAVVARRFQPAPPSGDTLDVWPDAAAWALRYWREVQADEELEGDVRAFAGHAFAGHALAAVVALAGRVSPTRGPGAG